MVFSCLDSAFGGVAAMVVLEHALKCNIVLTKGGFMLLEHLLSMMWRVGTMLFSCSWV